MSNPQDFGQNQAGAPQWGAPQQGYNPNQTQGFDPNQTQGFGQGYPQYGAPAGQQPQQWGAPQPAAPSKPLPWTLRELIIAGVGLLVLVFSFFPLVSIDTGFGGFSQNAWSTGGWITLVILPVGAAAIVAVRPFVPMLARIGSLSADQFASVAFSVMLVAYFQLLVSGAPFGWAGWLGFILAIGGVVLTVAAPFIPGLKEEFDQRPEETAPRAGRTTRVIPEGKTLSMPSSAPAANYGAPAQNQWGQPQQTGAVPAFDANAWSQQQAPAATNDWAAQQAPAADNAWAATPAADAAAPADNAWAAAPAADAVPAADAAPAPEGAPSAEAHDWATPVAASDAVADAAPVADEPVAEAAPVTEAAPAATQPFWALVPEERAVVDENGAEIFRVGPTAWALVVEDRGSSFVIRHDDGRTGVLTDVSGVTRN